MRDPDCPCGLDSLAAAAFVGVSVKAENLRSGRRPRSLGDSVGEAAMFSLADMSSYFFVDAMVVDINLIANDCSQMNQ